jgi:tocopherol O-methyltransferase
VTFQSTDLTFRGEHIHHGYWITPNDTKEKAQVQLIELLLERSGFKARSKVLDVGCGIGGTSRFLANNYGCAVTGVTISGRQVELAKNLTLEAGKEEQAPANGVMKLGNGSVQFIELDAEKMGEYFTTDEKVERFDCVWISEAMSHLPNKQLFFDNVAKLLNPGGKLMVADWFKNVGLSEAEFKANIAPIEG